MATTPPPYPKNIRLFKGALVLIDDTTNQKSIVSFQYNPESLSRKLNPVTVGTEDGNRSQTVRFTGAPTQTISLEVQIDCMEQLNAGDQTAIQQGIHPQLATLELLLYPASSKVISSQALAAAGALEIVPMTAPRTVFVWGPGRVVPVRVTSVSVTEQLFDALLNPVQAAVQLEMRVLSYSDVFSSNPDYQLFLTYQQNLETLAASVRAGSSADAIGYDVNKL
ncbi:hypothetical protein EHM82_01350 [bacterium]|nr:MAG: hypothetical protein EHM82_01350 [bacterium]